MTNRAMINAAVTMGQLQKGLDVTADNISNVNTYGYKSRGTSFNSLLFQEQNNLPGEDNTDEDRLTPDGLRLGTGAQLSATPMDTKQGGLQETGRTLDFALTQPNTFFKVQVADEGGAPSVQYTRNGTFYLQPDNDSEQMNLVTSEGHAVLDADNQPIQVNQNFKSLNVDGTGNMEVEYPQGTAQLGQLGLTDVTRPQLLVGQGNGRYTFDGLAARGLNLADVSNQYNSGESVVRQGSLEQSNVDLTEAMTDLTTMQRSYQFNARSIRVHDQMMGLVNSIR